METSVSISAGNRQPSGKQRPKYIPRHAGANNIAIRFSHNWELMKKHGADPVWGSQVGIMHLDGILTDAEADAAVYYAEVAGRYDRYHPNKEGAPRTPQAQSYNFGSRAADTEIQRHNTNGTIRSYERRAKKTQKLWTDVQNVVSPTVRDRLDELCLMDKRPNEKAWDGIKAALQAISAKFLLGRATREQKQKKAISTEKRGDVLKRRVASAIVMVRDYFVCARAEPKTFELCASNNELGIRVHGVADGKPVSNCVMVKLRRDDLAANVASMFLKECQAAGWTDHQKVT